MTTFKFHVLMSLCLAHLTEAKSSRLSICEGVMAQFIGHGAEELKGICRAYDFSEEQCNAAGAALGEDPLLASQVKPVCRALLVQKSRSDQAEMAGALRKRSLLRITSAAHSSGSSSTDTAVRRKQGVKGQPDYIFKSVHPTDTFSLPRPGPFNDIPPASIDYTLPLVPTANGRPYEAPHWGINTTPKP